MCAVGEFLQPQHCTAVYKLGQAHSSSDEDGHHEIAMGSLSPSGHLLDTIILTSQNSSLEMELPRAPMWGTWPNYQVVIAKHEKLSLVMGCIAYPRGGFIYINLRV